MPDCLGSDEARADRRLRVELDNLRAALDLARTHGRFDDRVRITLDLDQPSIWRDLRELWSWCLELAHAPEAEGHPREVEIRGAGAEAARQAGRFERAGLASWHSEGSLPPEHRGATPCKNTPSSSPPPP